MKFDKIKKISLYIFLGLIWCNASIALSIESAEDEFYNSLDENPMVVLSQRCAGLYKYYLESEWQEILPTLNSKSEDEKKKILEDFKNPEKNYHMNGYQQMSLAHTAILLQDLNYTKEKAGELGMTQILEWDKKYKDIKNENFIKKDLDFCNIILDKYIKMKADN